MKPFLKKVLGAGFFTLAISTPVLADPILVTDGTIVVNSSNPELLFATLDITGTRGFSMRATSNSVQGLDCGEGCPPGSMVSQSGIVFSPFFGTATLDGAQFVFNGVSGGGVLTIGAPLFTLPPADFGEATFETLFALTTEAFLVLATGEEDANPIRLNVAGSGRATSRLLVRDEPGRGTVYVTRSTTYDFDAPAVVPEPGSLLLVGGGLAAVWARRRRLRASRCTD